MSAFKFELLKNSKKKLIRTKRKFASMTSSVVIPTRNRTTDLNGTLPTLLEQTHVPDEILIVDQSSDDSTRKVVQEFTTKVAMSQRTTPRFIYLHEPNAVGAGAARNLAISQAKGDVLVFLDDDVLLEPDFLEEILSVYQRNPKIGGVSGVITNYSRPPLSQRVMRRIFRVGPFHDERQPIYWDADRLRNASPFPIRKFTGCVMSVRRSALGRDRFDDLYKGAGSEDVDLTWRLSERWLLVMTPRARLFHVRTQLGNTRDPWLTYDIKCDYYLFYRLWNMSIKNRLCFAWLSLGYVLLAMCASVKRGSLVPWRAFVQGIRIGREQVEFSRGSSKVAGR